MNKLTKQELCEYWGISKNHRKNWKFVEETLVHKTAKIGRYVKIGRWSKIGAKTKIGACAIIGDNAKIGAYAKIGDDTIIGANTKIGAYAKIGDEITIRDDTKIVKEQVVNRTPITSQVGRYILSEAGTGLIQTSYEVFTFEEVYNRPEDDWKKARYTEEQWQFVIDFARIVEQFQKKHPLDKAI